jgi:hypothetical protein
MFGSEIRDHLVDGDPMGLQGGVAAPDLVRGGLGLGESARRDCRQRNAGQQGQNSGCFAHDLDPFLSGDRPIGTGPFVA